MTATTAINTPAWLAAALLDLGQRETGGQNRSPWIATMWARQNLSWLLGQPWCGGAMRRWVEACGLQPPAEAYRAKSWATWGQACGLVRGAVLVFDRQGGQHVGILHSIGTDGRLNVLGGNQRDSVCLLPFGRDRLIATRWPLGVAVPLDEAPTIAASTAASSVNEA
ncbi:MAG: hypothetical protein RIQ53_2613 [Pseudomonadota bacterium]|jgi:uncharacterized protein (TIGR02594 family)